MLTSRQFTNLEEQKAAVLTNHSPHWHPQVNVVVMRGQNDDELGDFVELTRHAPLNVRFIEYMPFDGNVWSDRKMVPYREMVAAIERLYPQGLARLEVRACVQLPSSSPLEGTLVMLQ